MIVKMIVKMIENDLKFKSFSLCKKKVSSEKEFILVSILHANQWSLLNVCYMVRLKQGILQELIHGKKMTYFDI
jgi:hypothetical protein